MSNNGIYPPSELGESSFRNYDPQFTTDNTFSQHFLDEIKAELNSIIGSIDSARKSPETAKEVISVLSTIKKKIERHISHTNNQTPVSYSVSLSSLSQSDSNLSNDSSFPRLISDLSRLQKLMRKLVKQHKMSIENSPKYISPNKINRLPLSLDSQKIGNSPLPIHDKHSKFNNENNSIELKILTNNSNLEHSLASSMKSSQQFSQNNIHIIPSTDYTGQHHTPTRKNQKSVSSSKSSPSVSHARVATLNPISPDKASFIRTLRPSSGSASSQHSPFIPLSNCLIPSYTSNNTEIMGNDFACGRGSAGSGSAIMQQNNIQSSCEVTSVAASSLSQPSPSKKKSRCHFKPIESVELLQSELQLFKTLLSNLRSSSTLHSVSLDSELTKTKKVSSVLASELDNLLKIVSDKLHPQDAELLAIHVKERLSCALNPTWEGPLDLKPKRKLNPLFDVGEMGGTSSILSNRSTLKKKHFSSNNSDLSKTKTKKSHSTSPCSTARLTKQIHDSRFDETYAISETNMSNMKAHSSDISHIIDFDNSHSKNLLNSFKNDLPVKTSVSEMIATVITPPQKSKKIIVHDIDGNSLFPSPERRGPAFQTAASVTPNRPSIRDLAQHLISANGQANLDVVDSKDITSSDDDGETTDKRINLIDQRNISSDYLSKSASQQIIKKTSVSPFKFATGTPTNADKSQFKNKQIQKNSLSTSRNTSTSIGYLPLFPDRPQSVLDYRDEAEEDKYSDDRSPSFSFDVSSTPLSFNQSFSKGFENQCTDQVRSPQLKLSTNPSSALMAISYPPNYDDNDNNSSLPPPISEKEEASSVLNLDQHDTALQNSETIGFIAESKLSTNNSADLEFKHETDSINILQKSAGKTQLTSHKQDELIKQNVNRNSQKRRTIDNSSLTSLHHISGNNNLSESFKAIQLSPQHSRVRSHLPYSYYKSIALLSNSDIGFTENFPLLSSAKTQRNHSASTSKTDQLPSSLEALNVLEHSYVESADPTVPPILSNESKAVVSQPTIQRSNSSYQIVSNMSVQQSYSRSLPNYYDNNYVDTETMIGNKSAAASSSPSFKSEPQVEPLSFNNQPSTNTLTDDHFEKQKIVNKITLLPQTAVPHNVILTASQKTSNLRTSPTQSPSSLADPRRSSRVSHHINPGVISAGVNASKGASLKRDNQSIIRVKKSPLTSNNLRKFESPSHTQFQVSSPSIKNSIQTHSSIIRKSMKPVATNDLISQSSTAKELGRFGYPDRNKESQFATDVEEDVKNSQSISHSHASQFIKLPADFPVSSSATFSVELATLENVPDKNDLASQLMSGAFTNNLVKTDVSSFNSASPLLYPFQRTGESYNSKVNTSTSISSSPQHQKSSNIPNASSNSTPSLPPASFASISSPHFNAVQSDEPIPIINSSKITRLSPDRPSASIGNHVHVIRVARPVLIPSSTSDAETYGVSSTIEGPPLNVMTLSKLFPDSQPIPSQRKSSTSPIASKSGIEKFLPLNSEEASLSNFPFRVSQHVSHIPCIPPGDFSTPRPNSSHVESTAELLLESLDLSLNETMIDEESPFFSSENELMNKNFLMDSSTSQFKNQGKQLACVEFSNCGK